MAALNWKRALKTFLKFLISGLALFFVFRSVNISEMADVLTSTAPIPAITAVLFFISSKVLSAYRLLTYFKAVGLYISGLFNLRLAWVGMFYNLFLPGGIGGDGYKIYLLSKRSEAKWQSLTSATVLDRISGLVALAFLAGAGYLLLPDYLPAYVLWVVVAGLSFMFPVYFLLIRRFFPRFEPFFWKTNFYSFGVQGAQLICAYFILLGMGVETAFAEYLVLFLVSSVVAVVPFTIGGVGARELTFLLGANVFRIDQSTAVAFSLVFFLITAITSAIGGFLKTTEARQDQSAKS